MVIYWRDLFRWKKRGPTKVKETNRTIYFVNGQILEIKDIVEVDPSGTVLRITTKDRYYLINPAHVTYHDIPGIAKVF